MSQDVFTGNTVSLRQIAVFALAVSIAAFELSSYLYFQRVSVDFILDDRNQRVPVYRLGDVVSWQGQKPGALFGWWEPDSLGTWSVRSKSAFEVRLVERPSRDLVLQLWAIAFLDQGSLRTREVEVSANGTAIARWQFALDGPRVFTASIPRAIVSDDRVRIEFDFGKSPSPVELGINADYRKLGMLVTSWQILEDSR